jgi:putative redox protein
MVTSEVKYLGELRTECTHLASGEIIYTDAPIDNKGKGQKFSPTDLVATAYASCMLTIIGIYCQEHELKFVNGMAKITKVMASSPRRIGKIQIEMDLTGNGWNKIETEKVIRAGKACPVAKTLANDVEIEFIFNV